MVGGSRPPPKRLIIFTKIIYSKNAKNILEGRLLKEIEREGERGREKEREGERRRERQRERKKI